MRDGLRPRPGPLLAAAAILAAAAFSPRAVPYDMDEFVAYHALGCAAYPLSRQLNVYRERCADDELTPPFVSRPLPLRSYLYVGSVPAVPFHPLWRLLRDPVAARVQGAIFFLVALHLFARLAATSSSTMLLAALVFPLFPGAFLVDTGPVGLSLVLLGTALLLVRGAGQAPGRREGALRAAAAGLVVFLGVWVKLNFVWMLPAVLLYWGAGLRRSPEPRGALLSRHAPAAAAFLAAFLGPAAWLMLARTAGGERYIDVVRLGGVSGDPEAIVAQAGTLGGYFLDGSAAVPRVLAFPRMVVDLVPCLLAAALLLWSLRRERGGREALWLVGGALTFVAMLPSTRAWAAHHFVLGLAFVVIALAAALHRLGGERPFLLRGVAVIVAAYWLSLAARYPAAAIDPRDNFGKDRLLSFVRTAGLDQRTIQLHVSWGTYYIAHLFGHRDQAVLFSRRFPEDAEMLSYARAAAAARGRSVLVVTRRLDRLESESMKQVLGPPAAAHEFDGWWAVEYLR